MNYLSNKINLHSYTVTEAIDEFIEFYNKRVKQGNNSPIMVVHGYGSSGEGGKIRNKIRKLLDDYSDSLTFSCGETIDQNPGYTLIFPRKSLPNSNDLLGNEIIKYCNNPKTLNTIAGEFRKHGDPQIKLTIKSLIRQRKIKTVQKGKNKCYIAVD